MSIHSCWRRGFYKNCPQEWENSYVIWVSFWIAIFSVELLMCFWSLYKTTRIFRIVDDARKKLIRPILIACIAVCVTTSIFLLHSALSLGLAGFDYSDVVAEILLISPYAFSQWIMFPLFWTWAQNIKKFTSINPSNSLINFLVKRPKLLFILIFIYTIFLSCGIYACGIWSAISPSDYFLALRIQSGLFCLQSLLNFSLAITLGAQLLRIFKLRDIPVANRTNLSTGSTKERLETLQKLKRHTLTMMLTSFGFFFAVGYTIYMVIAYEEFDITFVGCVVIYSITRITGALQTPSLLSGLHDHLWLITHHQQVQAMEMTSNESLANQINMQEAAFHDHYLKEAVKDQDTKKEKAHFFQQYVAVAPKTNEVLLQLELELFQAQFGNRENLSERGIREAHRLYAKFLAEDAPKKVLISSESKKALIGLSGSHISNSHQMSGRVFDSIMQDVRLAVRKMQFPAYVRDAVLLGVYHSLAFGSSFFLPDDVWNGFNDCCWQTEQEGWKVFDKVDGCVMSRKKYDIQYGRDEVVAVRGCTRIKLSLREIRTILQDHDLRQAWDTIVESVKDIEVIDPLTKIVLFDYASPIPFIAGQEYIVLRAEKIDPDGKYYMSMSRSVEHPRAPPRTSKKRGEVEFAGFAVRVVSETECDVTYVVQGNHFIDSGPILRMGVNYILKHRALLSLRLRKFIDRELADCAKTGRNQIWMNSRFYSQSTVQLLSPQPQRKLAAVDFSQIKVISDLGVSVFGPVRKVQFHRAIYTMKELVSIGDDPIKLRQFFEEVAILRNLKRHKNVILFIGVCKSPLCMLTQYCERGSLRSVINDSTLELSMPQKFQMCFDIAKGMAHLERERIVHKSLTTRSVSVTDRLSCVVSDFGLSALQSDENRNMKFCAPEVLEGNPCTHAGDVWGFAITCIELFQRAELWDNQTQESFKQNFQQEHLHLKESVIVQLLSETKLLTMILMCTENSKERRPSFVDLCMSFNQISESMASKSDKKIETKQEKMPAREYVNVTDSAHQDREYANLPK